MTKRFFVIPIFILVLYLLTACNGAVPTPSTTPAISAVPTFGEQPEIQATTPSETGKWSPSLNTGSAKTLIGNCVVFMIFLSDGESEVDSVTQEDYLRYMRETDEFLTAQASACGQEFKLLYGEEDLLCNYASSEPLPSEMNSYWPFQILDEVRRSFDFETAAERYEADNIGYVLWLNKRGDFCYAVPTNEFMPNNVNDSDEICVMYTYSVGSDDSRYPMASASVLAHELLHLFGATDLYPHSGRTDADNELLNTVYTTDLMRYGTGNLSEKTLSDMDKFLIGWIPSLDEELWRFINWFEF